MCRRIGRQINGESVTVRRFDSVLVGGVLRHGLVGVGKSALATVRVDQLSQSERVDVVTQLGELIGRGGMADVYEGVDTRLGRIVAIKLLKSDLANDPSFESRFRLILVLKAFYTRDFLIWGVPKSLSNVALTVHFHCVN